MADGRRLTMTVMAKLVRIMWVPLLVIVCYTGWVFWQRHPEWPWAKPAPAERDPMAAYGKSVKILQFYTTTRAIAPGEKAIVCYGVVNATAVRLNPPVERL